MNTCINHPETELVNGSCPQCGYRRKEPTDDNKNTKAYTAVPPYDEYRQILSGKVKPTYQCCRCKRTGDVLLIGDNYYCHEHYHERRLELNYDRDKPIPNDWRDQMVGEIMAQHPEWNRRDDETKSEYVNRMLAETNKRLRRLNEKVAGQKSEGRANHEQSTLP